MSCVHRFISHLVALSVLAFAPQPSCAGVADPVSVAGPQRLLVVAVRFPGTAPTQTLDQIRAKIGRVDRYIGSASYGKAWLESRLTGWHDMPAPVGDYSVSPHNFQVDRNRVRRLVSDALGAARRDIDLSAYQLVWIVVGVFTRPGEGYGMIAYAANPGMLSRVRGGAARLETVNLATGGSYSGAVIVSAENANPGVPKLYGAPFVAGAGEHRVYRNLRAGVAVAPLSSEADGTVRVIVTTPERVGDFVRD